MNFRLPYMLVGFAATEIHEQALHPVQFRIHRCRGCMLGAKTMKSGLYDSFESQTHKEYSWLLSYLQLRPCPVFQAVIGSGQLLGQLSFQGCMEGIAVCLPNPNGLLKP